MLHFVFVTFFKCLSNIILLHFLCIRPVQIFVVHRKGQVIGVKLVVLTLIYHRDDIVVCHCFFCTLHFGIGLCSLGASNFVNEIVQLFNQDTCQLRYKPGFSVPLEGLGSQAVISNQFDISIRSNPVDDQDENNKIGNAFYQQIKN